MSSTLTARIRWPRCGCGALSNLLHRAGTQRTLTPRIISLWDVVRSYKTVALTVEVFKVVAAFYIRESSEMDSRIL